MIVPPCNVLPLPVFNRPKSAAVVAPFNAVTVRLPGPVEVSASTMDMPSAPNVAVTKPLESLWMVLNRSCKVTSLSMLTSTFDPLTKVILKSA